jgi:hypothetical protein
LLQTYGNDVSKVIFHLDERVRRRGTQTLIPPAFYGRDGNLYQPPSFELEIQPMGGGRQEEEKRTVGLF